MFPAGYFGPRYYPAPYFPKVGSEVTVDGPGLPIDLPSLSYRVDLPENLTRVDLVQP